MRTTNDAQPGSFELRFDALSRAGRGFSFPCDARGNVDLDALDDTLRQCYLYARALIGRDFAMRIVRPA
jgi:hypothetical protein